MAAEIEGTMRKELQMDDPDVEEQRYRALMGNGDEMLSMIWV